MSWQQSATNTLRSGLSRIGDTGRNGANPTSRREIGANKRKAYISYGQDWVLTILILVCFRLLSWTHGYWRQFSLTDESIQFPFTEHERIPNWGLAIIGLAPLVLMPLINVVTIRSWWDWHHSWLGLVLSLAITGVLTQAVKVTVGRPRPDLIARCMPKEGAVNGSPFGLVGASICTQTNMIMLRDGFRSFWSGHASMSFAGLGFLSWYLAGKLHLFDRRGHTFKAWLALTPLFGAMMVAISRTMDNRHHWHDVTVGSLVGLVISYFAYRQYYPPLSVEESHLPFEPRFIGDSLRGASYHALGVSDSRDNVNATQRLSFDIEGGPADEDQL
ncbi:acid phosphatase/Vanadium-dependent haloperoxidase [Clavulina sp. PMI_390]|nr:acid phosphatase/Vanadium-dependent haloperoxidase [Clavulina sp. PMI_390]